jgi:hypothetical protein
VVGQARIKSTTRNGHDDLANSVAGCCWLLLNEEKQGGINAFKLLVPGAWSNDSLFAGNYPEWIREDAP